MMMFGLKSESMPNDARSSPSPFVAAPKVSLITDTVCATRNRMPKRSPCLRPAWHALGLHAWT